MSDPTGAVPAEGTPAPESTPTSGPDYAPVMDRLSELAGTVGQIQEGFQQFQQAQQPPPEAEPDMWAGLFGEPEQQAQEQQQAQPQLDPQALQGAIQQAIQQANAPLQQQLQQLQMERATQQLYQQIPQLAQVPESHPDYAAHETARTETAQRVQQSLASYAPDVAQVLMNDPNYIATIFKAAEAENTARAQVPAGGEVPSLEAAGGAHPGGDGGQQSPIDQIYGTTQAALPKGFR